jgi:predicted metal-dependent hydrolase
MQAVAAAAPPPPLELRATVPLLGSTLTLMREPGRRQAHRQGQLLEVPADGELRPAVERWYRRTARAEIEPRLDQAARALGRGYARLSIRDQRTRWASCSASGTMSFNWRLLLAPAPALDYVVWHEACHLREMNHSRRFWALVAGRCPDYRIWQRWLRMNGASLRL